MAGGGWVLARILKMPVQNSNHKTSTCPNIVTHLLHIIPFIFIIIFVVDRLVISTNDKNSSCMNSILFLKCSKDDDLTYGDVLHVS